MKVTQKGQVTVPKRIRAKTGIRPGSEVEFIERKGQIILQKKGSTSPLDRCRGLLKDCGWERTDNLVNALRGRP